MWKTEGRQIKFVCMKCSLPVPYMEPQSYAGKRYKHVNVTTEAQ